MAILSKGTTYSDGDQVTSTNLNALVDSATFASGAVDDSTTQLSSGKIIVKDLGIATGKLAASAVTTAKIANSNVTKAKIENVANLKVLGNVSGSAAAPAEVAILDEDNMASNSATSLSTQQSIKAYADSKVDGTGAGSFTTLAASGVVSVADGSESAPAITNTGDTNTGIYFPDENSVALTAGAGARLTCSTSAITIDKPTTVVSAAQCELTLQGGDANSKNLIFKKASAQQGKIAAVGNELKFYAGTSGTESLEITTTGVVVPGTISVTGLIKQSGDTGFLDIQGGDTAGANIELYGASHASHANDAFYDADSHSFRPANGSSTNVIINSSGNVGIGTATPEHSLSIFKDANAARTEIGIDNTDQRLVLGSFYQSGGLQYATIQSTNNAETGAQALALQPDGGNVGIGTASPSAPLEVAGDVEINVSGASNTSKAIVINSSGTNFESDAGIIQATHAGSGSLTGGDWLKFNANSADKFSVRGDGRTEISSTTGGVIMPRMTTTQMNAISSPANGEMIYNTTASKFYGYAGGAWVALH